LSVKKNKWIDITLNLKKGLIFWPGDKPFNIKRLRDMNKGHKNNLSVLDMGAHSGTHMDAPFHFIADGMTIDKAPLDALIGPARIIEIKDKNLIKPEELARHKILRGERIIFKTKNSDILWEENKFKENFIYISIEAAEYLASKKIKLVGSDYLSVGGFHGDGGEIHRTLLGAGVLIVEGLKLFKVKPGKYDLICLPLKVFNADGAPARVAISPRK
jgi:arylformamidase